MKHMGTSQFHGIFLQRRIAYTTVIRMLNSLAVVIYILQIAVGTYLVEFVNLWSSSSFFFVINELVKHLDKVDNFIAGKIGRRLYFYT
jgi:hypothetical protein